MIVFRVSVAVGFIGYIMLILEFTGLGALFRTLLGPGASLTGECCSEGTSQAQIVTALITRCSRNPPSLWRCHVSVSSF
jgi:hypothetical protein